MNLSSELASVSFTASTNLEEDAWQQLFEALGAAIDAGDQSEAREIYHTLRAQPQRSARSLFKRLGSFESGKVTAISSRTVTLRG